MKSKTKVLSDGTSVDICTDGAVCVYVGWTGIELDAKSAKQLAKYLSRKLLLEK